MKNNASVESVIGQYLDSVKNNLTNTPSTQRDTLLRELKEHIFESIENRVSGRSVTIQDVYAVLSEMDAPESYAETCVLEPKAGNRNRPLIVLSVLCSGLQIFGLVMIVSGVPIVSAIAGFAAIVNFFLVLSKKQSQKWLIWLMGFAAACGLGMIMFEFARLI